MFILAEILPKELWIIKDPLAADPGSNRGSERMPAATASIRGKSAGGPGRGIRGAGQIANQRSASKCEGRASRAGRSPHTRGPCEQFSSTSSASRPVLANSLSDCTHSALVGFLRVKRLQARSERPGNLAFHDAMFSQLKFIS